MSRRDDESAERLLASLPPLPLDAKLWHSVVKALRLSRQHTKIVELILRTAYPKQIAVILNIAETTLKTYMQRIFMQTGTRCRVQLVIHVMTVAIRLATDGRSHPPEGHP